MHEFQCIPACYTKTVAYIGTSVSRRPLPSFTTAKIAPASAATVQPGSSVDEAASASLPGVRIEPPMLSFLNGAAMVSATAPQNEVAVGKHQQLFDDSFHQQFSCEELCTEANNNLIVTIILEFEWVGISPDIILTKLKNLKLEVHEPCGLRPFYQSYGNWEKMTVGRQNKAEAWLGN
jgi:hypothetical protein